MVASTVFPDCTMSHSLTSCSSIFTAVLLPLLLAISRVWLSTGRNHSPSLIFKAPFSPFRIDPLEILWSLSFISSPTDSSPRRKLCIFAGFPFIWKLLVMSMSIALRFKQPNPATRISLRNFNGNFFPQSTTTLLSKMGLKPSEWTVVMRTYGVLNSVLWNPLLRCAPSRFVWAANGRWHWSDSESATPMPHTDTWCRAMVPRHVRVVDFIYFFGSTISL